MNSVLWLSSLSMGLWLAGNRPYIWPWFVALGGLWLLVWAWRQRQTAVVIPAWFYAVLLLLAGLWLWGVAQVLPLWPAELLPLLPLRQAAQAVVGGEINHALSLDIFATLERLIYALGLGVWLMGGIALGQSEKNVKRTLHVMVAVGGLAVAYGAYQLAEPSATVWGVTRTMYQDQLTGFFLNANSFATYCGLMALVSSTLWVDAWQKTARNAQGVKLALQQRLQYSTPWLWLGLTMVFLGAVGLTDSRAGLAAIMVGLAVFVLAMAFKQQGWKAKIAAMSIVVFLAALVAVWVDARSGGWLAALEGDGAIRSSIYLLTWQAIQHHGWLGTGLGTFEDVFRYYRDASFLSALRTDHAHNTFLEVWLEMGTVGFALLMLSLLTFLYGLLRGLALRQQHSYYPAMGLAALVLVAVHGLFDFSAEMPAIAALFCLLLGMAAAQSLSRRATPQPLASPVFFGAGVVGGGALLGGLMFGGLAIAFVPAHSTALVLAQGQPVASVALKNTIMRTQAALAWWPAAQEYKRLGYVHYHWAKQAPSIAQRMAVLEAQTPYIQGLRRNPLNPYAWAQLHQLQSQLAAGPHTLPTLAMAQQAGAWEHSLWLYEAEAYRQLWPQLTPAQQVDARSFIQERLPYMETWQFRNQLKQLPELRVFLWGISH
ncbi:MAG: O-antigen ligase family protein [Alphaproteobacteria bacterium]